MNVLYAIVGLMVYISAIAAVIYIAEKLAKRRNSGAKIKRIVKN